MNKTLHSKLTEKHFYQPVPALVYPESEDKFSGLVSEIEILRDAAKDLLQPRPQAVARLLQMARSI